MRHLYTITTVSKIPSLGIYGPITKPTSLSPEEVLVIVRNGGKVFEHNPKNPREKVEVTQRNYMTITFKTNRAHMLKEMRKTHSGKKVVPVVNGNDQKSEEGSNDHYNGYDKKNKKNKYNNYNQNNGQNNDSDTKPVSVPDSFEKN